MDNDIKIDIKTLAIIGIVLFLLFSGKRDDPAPNPPDPVPVVDEAPFPSDGLTVVIIEETESRMRGELSPGHFAALTSKKVTDAADSLGAHFRVFDQHTPTEGMTETEQAAFKLPFDSLPWIHIAHGDKGFTGPLPDGVDGTISLMETYK